MKVQSSLVASKLLFADSNASCVLIPWCTTYQARIDPTLNAPKNRSSLSSWRNSSGGKRTLSPQGTFLKHSFKRAFAMSTFWSDNSLTLILLFSMGTKANPGLYRPSVICVAWRNSGKVQEKGGGIVAASCWHAHWPIVAGFFLSYHITMISPTSSFHPESDTVFIELHELRQCASLSVLLHITTYS